MQDPFHVRATHRWVRVAAAVVAVLTGLQIAVAGSVNVKSYGAVGDGITDDTAAINAALSQTVSRVVDFPKGVYKFTSTLTIPAKITLTGEGFTSDNTTPGGRAPSVLLKSFSGTGLILQDEAFVQNIQVEGAAGNGGDGIQIIGSRAQLSRVTVNRQGGNGVRVGADNNNSINANIWKIDSLVSIYNGGHGLYIHHSNTNTNASFPQGTPDVNAGAGSNLDLRSNSGDGLRVKNAIDNKFFSVTCQNNSGYGVRQEADARGHQYFGLYTEANSSGELLFDAGANNNIVIGNRAIAVTSAWVDNGTSNYLLQYRPDVPGWFSGKVVNVLNAAAGGKATYEFYVDTGLNNAARFEAMQSVGTGGRLKIYTKRNGDSPVSRMEIDETGEVLVTSARIRLTSSTGPLVLSGSGSPEGAVAAPVGSLWMRTNGGTNTTLYVKQSGTSTTGWAAK